MAVRVGNGSGNMTQAHAGAGVGIAVAGAAKAAGKALGIAALEAAAGEIVDSLGKIAFGGLTDQRSQAEKFASIVSEIELRRAQGEDHGYFKTALNSFDEILSDEERARAYVDGLKNALNEAKKGGEKKNKNVIRKINEVLKQAEGTVRLLNGQSLGEETTASQEPTSAKKPARKKESANQCNETQTVQVTYDVQNEEDIVEKFLADFEEQEKIAKEKAKTTQEQIWRIREAYATTDAERDAIAIERIKQKYEEELKLAEETGVEQVEVEKAKAAEIEAIKKRTKDIEMAKEKEMQDYIWQLREAAAEDEIERLALQRTRMYERYEEQLEKAEENAELMNRIESAMEAEAERIQRQLSLARTNVAEQYASSMLQVASGTATVLKASGATMKGIAITEATINTALAVSKALSSAPWPLSLALAAGAAASGAAQVAKISSQSFAGGGIVDGNSFYGDQVPVSVNSGEMILNKEQQKTLLDIAGGKEHDSQPQVNVTFAPNISAGINSEDVKKMLRENQSLFRSFLATEVSKGLSSAGAFA
jgi:hypothetical protein